jgi:hypothetical protein
LFGSQKETFHGNIIQFSFAELESATDNFSATNLIGLGGSSYVYRGRLKDGNIVAVKRLKDHGGPEADSACFKEVVTNQSFSILWHCVMFHSIWIQDDLKIAIFYIFAD